MSVTLIDSHNESISMLAMFARICVSPLDKPWFDLSKDREKNIKTVTNLYQKGHWSVFEHCSLTYLVTCSRSCSLQLARHRHISRTEMSQRYVQMSDTSSLRSICVFPDDIKDGDAKELKYRMGLAYALDRYHDLIVAGVKPEDARFLLPEAMITRMILTLNLRTLLELTQKRACNTGAQWEIRQLVKDMWTEINPDLKQIFKPELKWLDDEQADTSN